MVEKSTEKKSGCCSGGGSKPVENPKANLNV